VQQRFLPKYTCSLNPIEKLWMVMKSKWRRLMIERPEGMDEDEMVGELKAIIESCRDQCKNLATCHVQHMIRSLRGGFV
jgi:transposase